MPRLSFTLVCAYPLAWPADWPRTKAAHRRSGRQFVCTLGTALADLKANLHGLGITYASLSSWVPVSDRTGAMRADMPRVQLPDPGVCVAFVRGEHEHVLARDAFVTPLANLRSIGLAIAGLRAMERHGGTAILDRAFAGFRALPPPNGTAARPAEKSWRSVLGVEDLQGPPAAVWRQLARKAHPDNGGSVDAMVTLNRAIEQARAELGAR